MGSFEEKIIGFINKHSLLRRNTKILVGVSGGPDSLALLYFLKTIKQQYNLSLYAAHVDHMFRGEESYEEMKYVEKLCQTWNIQFEGKQINISEELSKRQGNGQSLSREMRYGFYKDIMEKHQIPVLALAHHGDDQIETILMRLTRGSAIGGSAGIRVKRPFGKGEIIRPFLCVTKAEIENYNKEHSLKPVYDPSNQKDIYTRNRFRKYVLPFLKEENHLVHKHFQKFSEELSEDDEFLMTLSKDAYVRIVKNNPNGGSAFSIDEFLQLPLPLQRRCIHLILNYLYKGQYPKQLSAIHINEIGSFIRKDHPSGELNLPGGLTVVRSYNSCLFTFSAEETDSYYKNWNYGETIHLPNGYKLITQKYSGIEKGKEFYILNRQSSLPLIVRTRNDGDRIRMKGLNGSKKLKSLFIDRKIPQRERNEWPIITDSQGRILWVPLLAKSAYEESKPVIGENIVLKYIKN